MIRLARYLKPFTLLIVLSIALLFTQAMADHYLSRIVNNGIQQSGVENPVPQAIRQSEMNKVTLFMSDADKATIV
jgi:ATP-binding cassette, subfamily B, multidrug efflux pump